MSDLPDLRVMERLGPGSVLGKPRPATPADVVAWLQANGGEVVPSDDEADPHGWVHLRVARPGRYLVYRLPDEEQP